MLLRQLQICNFRGFYGTHTIAFSADPKRPVTVIYGENGAGKTNLLNAIFWCLTDSFTPRLANPELLHNKAARDEDRNSECLVDLTFSHESNTYQAVRKVTGRNESRFSLYLLQDGALRLVTNPQQFVERIIPSALSRWFFFDAEAIGALELSGSEQFRKSLRRILGFELVDLLIEDLQDCLSKKQRNLANVSSSKELDEIQGRMEGVEHVLPHQRKKVEALANQLRALDNQIAGLEGQLRGLPKSKPLQERRDKRELQRKQRLALRKELSERLVRFVGDSAPSILAISLATRFEKDLHVKENAGKLPAPYSDQLVEDILRDALCVCGRPVVHGSDEERRILGLLKSASTSGFNTRVRSIQYLLKDIRRAYQTFRDGENQIQQQNDAVDTEIAEIDEELKEIRIQLQQINEDAIQSLEDARSSANAKYRELNGQHAILTNQISENERKLSDLQVRYDNVSKRIGHGEAVRKEIEKIKRLTNYASRTLKAQERRALNILQIELNQVLFKYLTKHFTAHIDPGTYEVELLDLKGRQVGRSTGEGQVLKFAFITTVVALAARKTQEKIDFLAEPTVAPLVLDAPFTALDPEYQGSVAANLATQATQLVLLLSSAAWSEPVANALEPRIGKRYVLISRQTGPKESKPVKTMRVAGQLLTLNEYDAERDESVLEELA